MRTLPLFYKEISGILPAARQKKYIPVHSQLPMIYWKIGERIVEKELHGDNRSEYGIFVTEEFSKDLSKQFGRGFSVTNIKNFRQFYLAFREKSTDSPLHKELSWTHYRIIMRVKDPDAREYYVRETAGRSWSTRQLARHIREQYYNMDSHSNNEPIYGEKAAEKELEGKRREEKRLEEKRAARAALDEIYREITAMAAKFSNQDSVLNSDSATAPYWEQGKGAG